MFSLLLPALAVLALAIHLLREARAQPDARLDHWLAYAGFAAVAAAGPIVLMLLLRRMSTPLAADAGAAAGTAGTAVGAASSRRWRLSRAAASIGLCAGVAIAGTLLLRVARLDVQRNVMHRLQAVAILKASLVEAWLDDTRDGIKLSVESPQLFEALAQWRAAGSHDSPAQRRLLDHLWRLSRSLHYTEIGLHDPATGALLLTTGDDEDTPDARAQAIAAASASGPTLEDFHTEPQHGYGDLRFLGRFAALSPPDGAPRLVVHVGLDPRHELFPLVEQWPGATSTAEVLLVRREGGSMAVLNDSPSRHDDAPAGASAQVAARSPARATGGAGPGSLAAQLAAGRMGQLMGADDRGRDVLAFATPVAGTSWRIVAKLDESEAYADVNRIAVLAASLAGALLLLGAWWWTEESRARAAERARVAERAEQARRLAELSQRVVSVQEDERRRWSTELHDRVGANLAAIGLNLKAVSRVFPPDAGEDAELLHETGTLLADTVASIREFCSELRPAILDHAGLVPALEASVAQLARRTGARARFDAESFKGRCSPERETMLFRIVQEALLNCAKHARATHVRVALEGNAERLKLTIEDDGVGFDQQSLRAGASAVGHGLLSMRERAEYARCSFEIDSKPGAGTRIVVASRTPS